MFENSMELMQSQSMKQVMLTTQQLQYVKLLSMNCLELNDFLSELNTENPTIEYITPEASTMVQGNIVDVVKWNNDQSSFIPKIANFDDIEANRATIEKKHIDDERYSMSEHLLAQLDFSLCDQDTKIMKYLFNLLDDNGFLMTSVEDIVKKGFDEEHVREAIIYLKSLDPAGVGAKNIFECLCLQLERRGIFDEIIFNLINYHLENLSLGHYNKISKSLGCDVDKIKEGYQVIRTLNPRPCAPFGHKAPNYVVPDITVSEKNGELAVIYNKQYHPTISVNRSYLALSENDDESHKYITKKLNQATWTVRAIESRNHTIESIAKAIVDIQKDFFLNTTDRLKPLRLKDIAKELSVHESTISRGVNDKYLECKKGVFPLKFFFSNTASFDVEGEESISSQAIKSRIFQIVETENKNRPLADSGIMKILSSEGIFISRRTVAKYRDELHIVSSTARKN